MAPRDIVVIYDRQCPVCEAYCRRIRIQGSLGELQRINARQAGPLMARISARDWDIDQGMVLKVGEQFYYGADALHVLALLSTPIGPFNRFQRWLFRSPQRTRRLYPLLRGCRNLLLKLLRRRKINNLGQPGNDRF